MRWIPFAILAYLVLATQTSLARMVTFVTPVGPVGPDLAAIVLVFLALRARTGLDVMLAAWFLGLGMDLTTAGGTGDGSVVGPMAIAYALAAGAVHRLREAFFRERAMTQGVMVLGFCLVSHGLWLTIQVLRLGQTTWPDYRQSLLQALCVGAYSALLSPLTHYLLGRIERWLLPPSAGRGR